MSEPFHEWFSLSYSNYLVLPRTILQSLPEGLQQRMVDCLNDAHDLLHDKHLYLNYTVQMRDKKGRFIRDDLADYERGRRRITLRNSDD